MSFVGPVDQIDGHYIRPHDIDIVVDPSDQASEAMIDRVHPSRVRGAGWS